MNLLFQAPSQGRPGVHASRSDARRRLRAAGVSALLLGAALPSLLQAAVPPVDPAGKAAILKCGTTSTGGTVSALHADKIVFKLTGPLPAHDPPDQPALDQIPRNTELDIKVTDNPKAIADLRGKVLSFLGAHDNLDTRAFVKIISVSYAVVCPTVK